MDVQTPHKNVSYADWRILLIDGDEDDFILIRDMLREARGRKIDLDWAATYEAGQTKLTKDRYDTVLVDNELGAKTGIELIRVQNERSATGHGATTPLILFTGRGSYEEDIEAMQAGATVYLSKNELSPLFLERFIRYAIERKQAETSLKESEEKFAKAFRASPAAQIITRRSDGFIVDVNESLEHLLGYSRAEIIGQKSTELAVYLTPQERDRVLEILKKEGRVYNLEMQFRKKSGSLVTILGSMEGITIGGEEYLLSTLIDITERKQAEAALQANAEALRESEQLFRLALRNAPVSLARQDRDLRFVWAYNQRSASRDQIIGHFDHEIFTPEEAAHFTEIKRRVLEEGIEQREQLWIDRPTGKMYLDICWEPIRDKANNIVGVASATMDLTPIKLAEAALRESEQKFRSLFEHSTEAIFLTFPDGSVEAANPAACATFGWSEEEIRGLGRSGLLDLEDPRLASALEERQRTGRFQAREYTGIRKGGERFPVEVDSVVLPGEPKRTFVILRDITERRQIQEALRKSEEKFAKAFRSSPIALAISTIEDGRFIEINDSYADLYGFRRDEIIGHTSLELNILLPEDRQKIIEKFRQGRGFRDVELHGRAKSGEIRDTLFSTEPIEIDGKEYMLSVINNITERKRAENALRESEERERNRAHELAAILDAVPAYIFITHDPDSHTMTANRAAQELLRSKPGDNISKSAPEPEIPRQFRAMRNGKEIPNEELPVQLAAAKCIHVEDYEFDVVFEDGSSRRLIGNAAPLCDEHGDPAGAVGAFIDITDLRRIEQETSERIAMMEVQRRLLEHREMERSQLARDLHDGPIQSLGGLGFSLQMLQSTVENQEARDMIEQMKQDVRDLVGELRGVCNELRPPLLERFGFRKAVQAHVDGFRERHPEIKLDLYMTENQDQLPENIATALFRIYQEALNNIIRHSQANEISIRFSFDPQQILLEIQDNGKGFLIKSDWVELARQGHFGLVGMKERAEAIGGEFHAKSSPGQGTAIRVLVPNNK